MAQRLMAGALVAALVGSATVAASPAALCTAAKLRIAERRARGLIRCETRALRQGGSVDAACITAVETRYNASWTRIEGIGGCGTLGDADSIGASVDGFVAGLLQALAGTTSTTTTTTSTSSSCPPPTALYCGVSGCAPSPALCPSGMSCTSAQEGCGCTGPAIPCADARLGGLSSNFCRWGTCPAGMTCGPVPRVEGCGFDCACQ